MPDTPDPTIATNQQERQQEKLEKLEVHPSLMEFIQAAWNILEPKNTFVEGEHLNAIVKHLEAVTSGEIKNLLINIPRAT